MAELIDTDTRQFAANLKAHGGRGFVVRGPNGRLEASHPWLEPLAAWVQSDPRDHLEHEGLFFESGPQTGALLGAFIHWTHRGQAAGGVRHWPYARIEDYIRDGLRLSVGMGRKNALAGLWWGGGKGIIARQPGDAWRDPEYRSRVYREYGSFMSSLGGCYVTAEDAGTTPPDMAELFSTSRHTTCIPPEFGGSGNPSEPTAKGVVCAMQSALEHLGRGSLEGKRIVMQGAGNVAGFMIGELLSRGVASIVASEISPERVIAIRTAYPDPRLDLHHVEPGDDSIFDNKCDVFAPNALGGTLNPDTIPRLKAGMVCGAANNQLLDDTRDAALLAERDISYVPDFVANRMGIVNCANEQYGTVPNDPAIERHFGRDWEDSIHAVTQRVLKTAESQGITSAAAAKSIADELAKKAHPVWPGRSHHIIEGLVSGGWHERRDR